MSNRKQRRRYFSLHVKKQKTPAGYLKALLESPYVEHRQQAKHLAEHFGPNYFEGEAIEDTEEV